MNFKKIIESDDQDQTPHIEIKCFERDDGSVKTQVCLVGGHVASGDGETLRVLINLDEFKAKVLLAALGEVENEISLARARRENHLRRRGLK